MLIFIYKTLKINCLVKLVFTIKKIFLLCYNILHLIKLFMKKYIIFLYVLFGLNNHLYSQSKIPSKKWRMLNKNQITPVDTTIKVEKFFKETIKSVYVYDDNLIPYFDSDNFKIYYIYKPNIDIQRKKRRLPSFFKFISTELTR